MSNNKLSELFAIWKVFEGGGCVRLMAGTDKTKPDFSYRGTVLLLQAGEPSLFICVIDVCIKNLEIVSGKMGKWELVGFEEGSVMQ